MAWLTVLSLLALYGISILKDFRTEQLKTNKKLRSVLFALMTVVLGLGVWRTIADDYKANTIAKNLQPFINLAIARNPNVETQIALDQLRKDLEVTKEMAKPNTISFQKKVIQRIGNEYKLAVYFTPTKNEPLGELDFVAEIDVKSKAQILDIQSTSDRPAFGAAGEASGISGDGKKARISYTLISAPYPGIELRISGPCFVKISGNRGLLPFEIEVK